MTVFCRRTESVSSEENNETSGQEAPVSMSDLSKTESPRKEENTETTSLLHEDKGKSRLRDILKASSLVPLFISSTLCFLQQWTGYLTVLAYTVEILNKTESQFVKGKMASIIVGVVQLVGTFCMINLIIFLNPLADIFNCSFNFAGGSVWKEDIVDSLWGYDGCGCWNNRNMFLSQAAFCIFGHPAFDSHQCLLCWLLSRPGTHTLSNNGRDISQ